MIPFTLGVGEGDGDCESRLYQQGRRWEGRKEWREEADPEDSAPHVKTPMNPLTSQTIGRRSTVAGDPNIDGPPCERSETRATFGYSDTGSARGRFAQCPIALRMERTSRTEDCLDVGSSLLYQPLTLSAVLSTAMMLCLSRISEGAPKIDLKQTATACFFT